ncbi:MAG: xanthan lyase, partial [Alistipes sp.]|nr:xanthan lyase [Alistipes sp.]
MKMINFRKLFLAVIPTVTLFISSYAATGVPTSDERREITDVLCRILRREVLGGGCKIERMRANGDRLEIYASAGLSYYPFREDNVQAMYDSIRAVLPSEYDRYKIVLYTDRHNIEQLIPRFHRTKASEAIRFTNQSKRPLVRRISSQNTPSQGLAGRHIAMWQSHGRYFEADDNMWRWQRSRLWETVEDLYTQSYVLPYLVPMLENAGANVLLPRERDTQSNEIIIDNDEGVDDSRYVEVSGAEKWQKAGVGFAHTRETYLSGQNPFKDGTTRQVNSITRGKESRAEWRAAIPEKGEYAVYVAYESFGAESADDATYTVHHAGGESQFSVNQTMGDGMWIYLGHFEFDEGDERLLVSLSNISLTADKKISADAV